MELPTCCANGHKLTQRFSFIAPNAEQLDEADIEDWADVDDTEQIIKALTSKTYICDICEVCGYNTGIVNNQP